MTHWWSTSCWLFGHDYEHLLRDRDDANAPVWRCPACMVPVAYRSLAPYKSLDKPHDAQAHCPVPVVR